MKKFATKEELQSAWAEENQKLINDFGFSGIKYNPFVYNGGWFIPGFGFSTERLDKGIIIRQDLINKL